MALGRLRGKSIRTSTAIANVIALTQQASRFKTVDGIKTNTGGAAIWMDDGKPYAVFHLEDICLNVDVDEYIEQKGL